VRKSERDRGGGQGREETNPHISASGHTPHTDTHKYTWSRERERSRERARVASDVDRLDSFGFRV
jgi:hypothetical protein